MTEGFNVKIECGDDLGFKEKVSDIIAASLRSHGFKVYPFITPENDTVITIGE